MYLLYAFVLSKLTAQDLGLSSLATKHRYFKTGFSFFFFNVGKGKWNFRLIKLEELRQSHLDSFWKTFLNKGGMHRRVPSLRVNRPLSLRPPLRLGHLWDYREEFSSSSPEKSFAFPHPCQGRHSWTQSSIPLHTHIYQPSYAKTGKRKLIQGVLGHHKPK